MIGVPLLLQTAAPVAVPPTQAGATYEVTRQYETEERSSDGSTGNSSGKDTLVERVVAVGSGGVEREYDLPPSAKREERARNWQFPARIFTSADGTTRLVNPDQLAARLVVWLKAAGLDRSSCGRTIFTWNAFRIECDPQSVLATAASIDLGSIPPHDGATVSDPAARAPAKLMRRTAHTFVAAMDVDPSAVRRARAENDVTIGEIMRQPVMLETALASRAKEIVSGSIAVTVQVDDAGAPLRRTTVSRLEITRPDGVVEERTSTVTVTRHRIP